MNDSDCIACGPGLVPNAAQIQCLTCADFEYSRSNGSVCHVCGPGNIANFHQSGCIACEYYQYSGVNDSVCHACSPGQVPNEGQSGCVACQSFEVSTKNDSVCQPCGVGKVPNNMQTECLSCQNYEYSAINVSTCSPCGTGKIPTNDQSECISCVPYKEYSAIDDSNCHPFLDQEFLSNQSFTMESSCDDVDVHSSCAMAVFSAVVDVAVNVVVEISGNSFIANASLEEQTKFVSFIRSQNGSFPRIDSSCENTVEEDLQVFAECNSLLPDIGLPVQPKYRVIRNSSCNHQRGCRNMLLEISFQLVANASSLFRKHLESVGDISRSSQRELADITSIRIPLDTKIGTFNDPSLLQMEQVFNIDFSLSDEGRRHSSEGSLRNVDPAVLLVRLRRDTCSSRDGIIHRTVKLSLERNDEWTWNIPVDAQDYIGIREDGPTIMHTSGLLNTSQKIEIYPNRAPSGRTVVNMKIQTWNQVTEEVDSLSLQLTLLVQQAFARTSWTRLQVVRSMAHPVAVRSFNFANDGEHEMLWSATLLNGPTWARLNETMPTIVSREPLPPGSDMKLDLSFIPNAVSTTGRYYTYLVIETNAWDGDEAQAPPAERFTPNPHSLNGTRLWIKVEFFVTTVFIL